MKKQVYLSIIIPIIIFFIISIITILSSYNNNLYIKQIIWYFIGFILIYVIYKSDLKPIFKNIEVFYIIGNIILLLLLIFGNKINNSKCWITIPNIGNIQPSEFMKIILIIINSKIINNFKNKYKKPTIKQEFKFLSKIFLIVLIPSILTFKEPDTGMVIIYIIITLSMIFISGIRYRWFISVIFIIIFSLSTILFLYFYNQNLFVNILGNSFFLRIERLTNWSNKIGYQLTNGIASIGSGGLYGLGFNKTPLFFPESSTDFIFAIIASNYGFITSFLFIILLLIFDINLFKISLKTNKNSNKYIIIGILSSIIFSQFQSIGMTLSIMPIMGITLPFISYGGSSLISYMLMIGIIFNIEKR